MSGPYLCVLSLSLSIRGGPCRGVQYTCCPRSYIVTWEFGFHPGQRGARASVFSRSSGGA